MLLRDPYSIDTGFPINRDCGLNRGLVAWYLGLPAFAGGSTWRDLTNDNHGTLVNMVPASSWVPAIRRGAWFGADFDGLDDYVDCGDKQVFEFAGDFTVSCRFRSTRGANQGMVTKWTGLGSASQWFLVHYNNTLRGGIYTTDGGAVSLNGGTGYMDGNWHHAVLVRRGSAGYLYVDGEEKASQAVGVQPAGKNTAPLTLGNYNGQGTWPYQGRLDDIRLFDRALSQREITELDRDSLAHFPQTLNRLRRWFPAALAPTGAEPPYSTAAGRVWHTGALLGQQHVTGQQAGQLHLGGPVAGQIHG